MTTYCFPISLLEEWGCCVWIEKDMWEENDCVEVDTHWKTSCGKIFKEQEGLKPTHDFDYCPYCSKDIEVKP